MVTSSMSHQPERNQEARLNQNKPHLFSLKSGHVAGPLTVMTLPRYGRTLSLAQQFQLIIKAL